MVYAQREGPAKLEKVFEKEQIDIFNLERKSVI
jgi:hypothetical protein